jgi:hypothetical protein
METASSLFLYFRYKNQVPTLSSEGLTPASLIVLKKVYAKYFQPPPPVEEIFDKITYIPSTPYSPDSTHGYKAIPGEYIFRYTKKVANGYEHLNVKNTFNNNGTRFVGYSPSDPLRNIYVFGDSFIFGEGVSDEQSFTYLLQSTFRNSAFHLYALGGYSWTNAYMNFMKIRDHIKPDDILIIGYAEFYKERHVASPSRLKYIQQWVDDKYPTKQLNPEMKHLRAQMDGSGNIAFDTIPFYCKFNKSYCEQKDPSAKYVNDVTISLIKLIAKETKARIFLLHIGGPKDDPVLSSLPKNVELISALPQDYDYIIWDDILGFDDHPGPYWHYAMYSKLKPYLSTIKEGPPKALAVAKNSVSSSP